MGQLGSIMSMSGISLAADFDLAGLKSQSWAQLVIANDESFEVASSGEAEGVEQAFGAASASLQAGSPAYLIIKLEDNWVACLYVPETAKPRQKMIYGSSFEALKHQLSLDVEVSMQGSAPDDFSYEEYVAKISISQASEGNLTQNELQERDLARAEQHEVAAQAAHASGGLSSSMGLSPEAEAALNQFGSDTSLTRLLLRLDLKSEVIVLVEPPSSGEPCPLPVDDQEPVYSYLRCSGSLFFVYACHQNCKVRAKMIYSSSKGALLGVAAEAFGLKPDHKFEVGSIEEITQQSLIEISAPTQISAPSVVPLARPGGKARSRPLRSK